MITKGIVIKLLTNNKLKVRLPIFENTGFNDKVEIEGTVCYSPGNINSYKVGDIVYVGFEDNKSNSPVILGKLYLGKTKEAAGFNYIDALEVINNAKLPTNTTIGGVPFNNVLENFKLIKELINIRDIFVNSIQFKTNNEGAGKLFFNDEEGTLQVTLSPNVTMAVGVDSVLKVYNDTDTPFVDGQIVYMSGNISGMSKVQLSKANDYDKVNKTIGVVTESIASHEFGFITREGFVENILIDPSIYVNGDTLYLSPTTDGAFTKQKPISPNFIVQIGHVNKVSSDSITADGQIYVNINIIPILPTASTTVAGVVKIGTGLSMTDEVLSVINPGFDSQTKKTFLAAPNATDGVPTFREIIAADMPTLNQDTTGNAGTATKLATARTFTITDNDATNVQASATNFDGSANFTVKLPSTIKATITGTASGNLVSGGALGTPLSGTLTNCTFPILNQDTTGSSAYLSSLDDRTLPPTDMAYNRVRTYFTSLGGLTGTADSNWQDFIVLNTYIDNSGGDMNALAFDKSEMKIRHYFADQAATSWGTPKTLAYTDSNITGTAANVTGTVAIENGGTGATTAVAAFKALSPMTTVGDMIYAGGDFATGTRLAGNITTTRQFLISVGNGIQAGEPTWGTVTKTDVGLSNVDNTSDDNKPVSTATQTALNLKANLASPELTGTPLSVTATKGTNTTQIATTAFVQTAIGDYVPTTRKVNGKALNSDVSLALENLSNVATEDPATEGQFLVSDGFNWAPTTITLDNIDDGSERKLSNYVTKNTAITGATKTKITYDSKGLVTAGENATLDDIGDGSTRKLANYLPLTGGTLTDNLTIATDKYLIADHISNSGSLEISAQSGVDIIAGQNDGDIRLLGLTEIKPNLAGSVPLKVVGYSGLTVNIAEFYNNNTLKLSINKDGQLVSPIATGTSPLSVTSTTVNTNLNADKLDGADLETTLSTTSDVKIPSSKAIATYIANKNYLDSSSTLDDLNDVVITTPVIADLLRYNGTNWANAPASGTYAGPTETLLGHTYFSDTLTVADIDNYDEIILELFGGTQLIGSHFSYRTVLPTTKFTYNFDTNTKTGGGVSAVADDGTLIYARVVRGNTAGTSLFATISTNNRYTTTPINKYYFNLRIYGRNW